ncbi:bifunctional lysylphosphatidylglycerol flippase/synthetase MprF [Rhizobium sp. CFBP 13726]|uniref:phosphatidylglycerol lysyltransferase domain-containing protein n=1 Tax=Rhizobium sp. CFBP 13726 TaxID=2775296 RepID=UPI0017867DA9|nr:phosphatidylglycerol lysyltransferase domain-containing protein [Rhizobium sp. CFBP 13726]MBD8649698.1 bifunctional lysylphosphatidylglycerol flippase/synthetase MprF [Rhizobium sp. CFBP 13726]
MADIAHETMAPAVAEGEAVSAVGQFGKFLAERLLDVLGNRGLAFYFALIAFTVALSLYVFLEENLLAVAWRLIVGDVATRVSAGFVTVAFVGSLAASRHLRIPRPVSRIPSGEDLQRALDILALQPNASAGLVRLGDKKVLFSDCGNAFVMYARSGRSWAALFDPVGCRKAWPGLIVKFMNAARRDGCRAVFYQVSPEFLPCAVEAGLKPYKLGEQAVVHLTDFDLKGGAWLKLRRSINRAERDGLEFSLLPAEAVPGVMDELIAVSRAWLAAHNAAEKGFSLGTFQPAYVAAGPVAVIRLEGRIVAFANIHATSSNGDAFIDLMRHVPNTHRGMMDLLFVRIMEHFKSEGYRTLNLGMAPLSGLATHRRAPLWNHIGNRIFENGERFYNFRGVHAFKSKFDPEWQPRYLAVSGRGMPLVALFDVTKLIAGGLRGILRR